MAVRPSRSSRLLVCRRLPRFTLFGPFGVVKVILTSCYSLPLGSETFLTQFKVSSLRRVFRLSMRNRREPTSGLEPLTPAPATSLLARVLACPSASGSCACLGGFRRSWRERLSTAHRFVLARLRYGGGMLLRILSCDVGASKGRLVLRSLLRLGSSWAFG